MLAGLFTGNGFWHPLLWLLALAIALIVVLIIWSFGSPGYQRGTEQTKPFLSGQPEKEKEHVRASNIYWGFLEALKGYYDPLVGGHTGIGSDYVAWFLGTLVIIAILVLF